MTSTLLHTVILLACILEYGATQQTSSCKGRCGGEFLRGASCQCDYTCLIYGECCKDYESQCTTKDSCKGRCGEGFKRGRLCSCDSDCVKYNQCCPDFKSNCGTEDVAPTDPPVQVTTQPAPPETTPPKTTPPKDVQTTTPKAPTPSKETVSDASSCKGRCGAGYLRGAPCQCDFTCLIYGECCKDYESQCTSKDSCNGRCGEGYKRGQPCSCDSDCMKFKQCCPDYQASCTAEEPTDAATDQSAYSEGNNPDDDVMPQDGPTSDPMVDDPYGNIIPDDDPSANGVNDPEAFPDPDGDYKPSVDHSLVEISTESTPPETKPSDDVTGASKPGTTPPQPTTPPADPVTIQSTSVSEIKPTTLSADPEAETLGQVEKQTEAAGFPSTEPEVATIDPQESITVRDQTTASPSPSTVKEKTTAKTESDSGDVTAVPPKDPSISPEGPENPTELDAATTRSPPSTTDGVTTEITTVESPQETPKPTQPPTSDDVTPEKTTAESPKETPEATIPTKSDVTAEMTTAEPPIVKPTQPPKSDEATSEKATAESPIVTAEPTQPPKSDVTPEKTTAESPIVTAEPTQPPKSDVTPEKATAESTVVTAEPTQPPKSDVSTEKTTAESPIVTAEPTQPPKSDVSTEKTTAESPIVTPEPTQPPKSHVSTEKPTSEPLKPTIPPESDVTPEKTTAEPLKETPKPTQPPKSEPASKPQESPNLDKPLPDEPESEPESKPESKPFSKPLDKEPTQNTDDPKDYPADESDDKNLCNGQPIGGVTTLSNGTVVVFRGHYFWVLDRNKVPGPAQGITQTWGIPSPIDTVFSRCNCLGKTYMFKGGNYWRFDNGNVDPGYPRAVKVGFDGLQGQITAALSVPQYRKRREAVYFFKRGGQVQKYTYQFGTSSSCNRKVQPASYTIHKRRARQAVSVLQPAISIQVAWKGFPSTITAAVSIPTPTEAEKYKYYVFSNSQSYNVRMDSGRPVIPPLKDNDPSPKTNEVFKCPAKKH